MKTCLVTGGAGFIGSHTVDLLLERGYRVRVLDIIHPSVHPRGDPAWLSREAEFIRGDVLYPPDVEKALDGVDAVIHLASNKNYPHRFSAPIHTNAESAALLFEILVARKRRVEKVVFGSSRSVCGMGKYVCLQCASDHHLDLKIRYSDASRRVHAYAVISSQQSTLNSRDLIHTPPARPADQLESGDWDMHCSRCGEPMIPVLNDEETSNPLSAHQVSEYAVELLANRLGRLHNIPTICMRYGTVQGSRCGFSDAAPGIAGLFATRLSKGRPVVCFEDGLQMRDYVHVRDAALANVMALEDPRMDFGVFNVGGGRAVTVREYADMMTREFGGWSEPEISGRYRPGDRRHCVSDISRLSALGWRPNYTVEEGVRDYVAWIREQEEIAPYFHEAERSI